MAYPDSHGSCGGNVGECRIALMNATSIHFSPPAVVISGLLARANAMKPNAIRKRTSVVIIRNFFSLSHAMSCVVLGGDGVKYAHALNPATTNNPSNRPPISFWAMPRDANNQKTYPQANRP